jgi:uncharacterized protein YkwD
MVCSMRWLLCLALLILVLSPTRGSSQTAKSKSSADRKDRERIEALLEAHNRVREEAKLPPLTLDPRLNAAALVQATDMAKHEMMGHEGTDGSSFHERIGRQGYRFKAAAENVAFGQKTTAQVMKSWMNSPHHKENILGPYAQVGFGIAQDKDGRLYWCADFATPWTKPDAKAGPSEVVEALNQAREEEGLKPLTVNSKLMDVASWAAKAMAAGDFSKSQEQMGTALVREVKKSGYKPQSLAESTGAGQTTGAEVAKQWLASPTEKKIILGDFSEVGVGVAASEKGVPHWCLILARPARD